MKQIFLWCYSPSSSFSKSSLCPRGKQVIRCLQRTVKHQESLRKDSCRQLHIFHKLGIGNFLHLAGRKHQRILIWFLWTSALGLTLPVGSGALWAQGWAPAPACSWVQEYIHWIWIHHRPWQGKDGSSWEAQATVWPLELRSCTEGCKITSEGCRLGLPY